MHNLLRTMKYTPHAIMLSIAFIAAATVCAWYFGFSEGSAFFASALICYGFAFYARHVWEDPLYVQEKEKCQQESIRQNEILFLQRAKDNLARAKKTHEIGYLDAMCSTLRNAKKNISHINSSKEEIAEILKKTFEEKENSNSLIIRWFNRNDDVIS